MTWWWSLNTVTSADDPFANWLKDDVGSELIGRGQVDNKLVGELVGIPVFVDEGRVGSRAPQL